MLARTLLRVLAFPQPAWGVWFRGVVDRCAKKADVICQGGKVWQGWERRGWVGEKGLGVIASGFRVVWGESRGILWTALLFLWLLAGLWWLGGLHVPNGYRATDRGQVAK